MARSRSHTRRTPRVSPRGVLVAHAGGYGFVQTAEGEFFIPAKAMGGAFDGDLVELAPISKHGKGGARGRGRGRGHEGDKPEARVVRVLDRAHDTLIGRYEVAEPFGVVVPEDPRIPYDIFTMRSESPDVEDGALVRVRITQFPTRHTAATGVVEEVIGHADDAGVAIDLIIARHKLETVFSEGALAEARAATLDAEGALNGGYRDIRDRFVFTIDPADAKDFDDAISICSLCHPEERSDEGSSLRDGRLMAGRSWSDVAWRLGVHIADVSHYVPWSSSIDLDARRRATSVYLVDRVIPMLPHELSDDLCSLRPHEDRRSMTVDLYLDEHAQVVAYDLYPALIQSKARLSYEQALAYLEDRAPEGVVLQGVDEQALIGCLKTCSDLARKRAEMRTQAGGLDFETVEAKVRLNEEGKPAGIVLRAKNASTELIEEAMILANETVAAHLAGLKWPCVYRVHEQPSADALAGLVPAFGEFPWFDEALALRLSMADPHAMQEILAASKGRPEGELVSSLLLRAMKRALYRPSNDGHFGLASGAYCHFTSPIRRYPDLVVHRMLRAQLTKRPGKFNQEENALAWISEHSSDMERIADAAARESQELMMVEYLTAFVGQSFSGIVSGVASYGLYVRLECTAEGLLPMRSLGNEYFVFDYERHAVRGSDTGKVYRLGQRIPVVLKVAEPRTGKLEFALADGRKRKKS